MAADRVLYESRPGSGGSEICVTTRWCTANGVRYPIAELTMLGLRRGRRSTGRGGRVVGLVVVTAVLLVAAVAIGRGWTRQIWVAVGATLVATAALTALPAVLGRALHRPYEIWARYEDAPVLLFVTADPEQYGQVARALVRARELGAD
jgi:hypothetical protein